MWKVRDVCAKRQSLGMSLSEGLELEASSSLASRSYCNAWTHYLLEPVPLGPLSKVWTVEAIAITTDHSNVQPGRVSQS